MVKMRNLRFDDLLGLLCFSLGTVQLCAQSSGHGRSSFEGDTQLIDSGVWIDGNYIT